MRLFISGPMRGIPNHNFPAFEEARLRLRNKGNDVYCPAESNVASETPEELSALMKSHLEQLLKCDAVIVLPGWSRSEGSKVEITCAVASGIPIYAYHKHRPEVLELLTNVKIITRAEILNV